MQFPKAKAFLYTIRQEKARTLWAVDLLAVDAELRCTLLSKSWENFRSFFKLCWNFLLSFLTLLGCVMITFK
jgi:hypothetical protein